MKYSTQTIAKHCGGELLHAGSSTELEFLVIDSRKIVHHFSSVFFAIRGQFQDGHDYLEAAYREGVRCFVISDRDFASTLADDASVIWVENSLVALQKLVGWHRRQFDLPVIGITGSNGKTIVKDWLSQMLSIDRNTIKSPRSYNSQVGVPLSVWPIDESDEIAVFEAGISEPGEMENLERIIEPTIGIFTNIGVAHSEGFSSRQQKVSEKLKLFRNCPVILFCSDYREISEGLATEEFKSKRRIGWSWNHKSEIYVEKTDHPSRGTQLTIHCQEQTRNYLVPFRDPSSLENSVHCILAMEELGYTPEEISPRLLQLHPPQMRMEMKRGKNNCTILNDSYSSDLDSLRIALDTLGQLNQHEHRTLIISDILQTGIEPKNLYKKVADLVSSHRVDFVIGVGEAITRCQDFFPEGSRFFLTTTQLIDNLHLLDIRNQDVLVKGARIFGFERVVQQLEEKVHQTVLEVNLNAMVHNLNAFRKQLNPETKLMIMVKAASYGTGSYEVANLLQYYHVDYLAVAYTDEGVTLRNAGITLPIMVMSPEAYRFDVMAEYNLEPEIYSFESLKLYLDFAMNHEVVPGIHLKVDTGMHRLGFDPGDETEIISLLRAVPEVKVLSVFSHLAAGDDPSMDEFTREQISMFKEFSYNLSDGLGYRPVRHILNSGGIQRFPEAQFDMARLGVGLYGIGVNETEQKKLEQTIRLKTVISQIKELKPGDSVGYGRSFVADSFMKIATVPVGYADGLRRALSNGKGKMSVHGNIVPIVGRICMDMTMLDVTGLQAEPGDEVYVIGDEYTVLDMARDLGTIPYEVLTGISERVKRIYIQE